MFTSNPAKADYSNLKTNALPSSDECIKNIEKFMIDIANVPLQIYQEGGIYVISENGFKEISSNGFYI